jgi:hypothetical protein
MAAPIDIKTASHILFRVLTTFQDKHNTYENLVYELLRYIDTIPSDRGSPTLEVKITTLVGNSEPTNPAGQAQRFLNTYFTDMNAQQRRAYFKVNYFGSDVEYTAFLASVQALNDNLRLSLSYTATFIILAITNRRADGSYTPLFHITISRDPRYDVAGQHGIPTTVPIKKSIHFTDETTNKHYFVKYSSFSSPLNEDAADLLSTVKPGRWGGKRKTIRRKKSKHSKKRGTSKRGVRRSH